MKNRLIWLSIITFFSLVLGYVQLDEYPQNTRISITGNINKIYQKESECIIVVGRFWINFRNDCSFSRLDRVAIIGRVNASVIDRFLGRLWLDSAKLVVSEEDDNNRFIDSVFVTYLKTIRENLTIVYRRYLPVPESGLVAGIIFGNKNDIGQDLYQSMVSSGTIHIAVASGYNIMLVGGSVLSVCFWFFKRKQATVMAIFVMMFYALEAGGEPPVVRALIMAGAIFGANIVGRKTISWWILLLTGWLMLVFEPLLLIDVSFQLSMAASVGLLIIEPWLRKTFSKTDERLADVLGGSGVLTSVSTMLVTLPIIWWHFGRMSLIGVLSNTLILPLIPALMIFGAAMQILPGVFYIPTYAIAHWIVGVIRFFGS